MASAPSTYVRLHLGLGCVAVLFLAMGAVCMFCDLDWLLAAAVPVLLLMSLLLVALCRCKACGESPMRMGRIDSVCRRCGANLRKQF